MIRTTPVPFLGECYADEARPFSSQDVCNWLPAPAEKGGTLTPEMGQTPPGLRPFVQVSGSNASRPVRGTHNCEGKLFSVIGNTLVQISNAGVAIPIGTVPGTTRVASAHNQVTSGNQLVVVNGSSGYVYDTSTEVYERITDDGYPGAITADFVDGYIVGIEPARRFAFNSDLANAKAYNTLDRFTSEYRPDLLVTQVVSNNELILLSETSGEVFYNSGAAQQPFRTKRVFFDKGCSGRSNAKVIDNSFVFHANDGMFYLYDNGTPKRISTRPIEQAVRGLNWTQAFCEVWVDGGHSVAYWTFPGGHTWGWDASSGKWHRRASYGLDRWRVNTLTRWKDKWIAGDFQAGRLWVVDWDYLLEGDQEFISEITGVVISDSQNPLKMPRLEVLMDVGQEMTVPVAFPEQPEGPTISGNAPDGQVGVGWGPYSYLTTGGTPPYTYTSRPGTVQVPGNPALNSAGVLGSGTPTTVGTYPQYPRVTDANGLWDELPAADNIAIIAPPVDWLALVNNVDGLMYGLEGDWSTPLEPSPGAETWQVAAWGDGEVLLNNRSDNVAFSDDKGATWTVSTLPATVGGNKGYLFRGNGYWWIPSGNTTEVQRGDGITFTQPASGTAARGESITSVTATPNNTLVMVAALQPKASRSTDNGVTWAFGSGDMKPAGQTATRIGIASNGPRAVVAGIFSSGGYCAYSDNGGNTWADCTVPALTGAPTYFTYRGGKFIFGTEQGEVCYSTDGITFVQAGATGAGRRCQGLDYDGTRYTAVFATSSIDGYMCESLDDMATWTPITPVSASAELYSIVAMTP